jgi:hypothetical protein
MGKWTPVNVPSSNGREINQTRRPKSRPTRPISSALQGAIPPRLPPMVQNVELVGYGNAGSPQVANRSSGVAILHITAGIIVHANHQSACMLAASRLHQQVQVFEVVMVLGEQCEICSHSVHQVARVRRATETCIHRDCDVVTSFSEELYQRCLGAIIVQIEIHATGPESQGA